jgi:hypothetical protein
LLRSIQPSTFSSPVCHDFDSIEQAKFRHYRTTSSVKSRFDWKNDPIAHNNDRDERNTSTNVYALKYPESKIGVGDIE